MPKLDLDQIAKTLGAERRGSVQAGSGFLGAAQLAAETRDYRCTAQAMSDNVWGSLIGPEMTLERAQRIRCLRVDERSTWRKVAANMFVEWGGPPPFPQGHPGAGEMLCILAAEKLGQDPFDDTWN